jgi:hypothetical protein
VERVDGVAQPLPLDAPPDGEQAPEPGRPGTAGPFGVNTGQSTPDGTIAIRERGTPIRAALPPRRGTAR